MFYAVIYGQVAQSVEHGTENAGVGSSILPLATGLSRSRARLVAFSAWSRVSSRATVSTAFRPRSPKSRRSRCRAARSRRDRCRHRPPSTQRARVARVIGRRHDRPRRHRRRRDPREHRWTQGPAHRRRHARGVRRGGVLRTQSVGLHEARARRQGRPGRLRLRPHRSVRTCARLRVARQTGRFFNARSVSEGYASQLTVPPNVRYADLFSTART